MAAGMLDKPLSAVEVFETTERVRGDFLALLRAVIAEIAPDMTDRPTLNPQEHRN
jgi:hypothetical protein